MKKLPKAEEHLEELSEYLKTLETSIIAECGEETLAEWRATESDWKARVVDINQHADLVSPYEMPKQIGELHAHQSLTYAKSDPVRRFDFKADTCTTRRRKLDQR